MMQTPKKKNSQFAFNEESGQRTGSKRSSPNVHLDQSMVHEDSPIIREVPIKQKNKTNFPATNLCQKRFNKGNVKNNSS